MLTFFQLLSESAAYARKGNHGFFSTFLLLIRLYSKSKFSKRDSDSIHETIGEYTFHSFDYPSLINMYRDIFLREVYRIDLEENEPLIIDCGANIGVSVLYFTKRYPNSEIWAFEPNPVAFQMLKANVEANNIQNVKLFNCAVGNQTGSVSFHQPKRQASINGSIFEGYADSTVVPVEVVRLSHFIKDATVDLIKLDIEGSEEMVISDLEEQDKMKHIEAFVIEHHPKVGSRKQLLSDFISRFERAGFHEEVVSSDEVGNTVVHLTRSKT